MITRCVIPTCRNNITAANDLSVCDPCGMRIARRYRAQILGEARTEEHRKREAWHQANADRTARNQLPEAIAAQFAAYEQPPDTTFVYYVRIGDYIKIGYTTNVLARLRALRVPVDDLLALEPGGRDLEQRRHAEFAHLRITRRWENFRPGPDLGTHIRYLNAKYGLPQWLHAPRRGKNGPVQVKRAAK